MMNREHDRVHFNSDVGAVIDTSKGMFDATLLDISESGAAIVCESSFQSGAKFLLILRVNDDIFEVDVSAVYCNPYERNKFRIGLRFKSMDKKDYEKFLSYFSHSTEEKN